jgi:Polysaccharide biosynthesis protein
MRGRLHDFLGALALGFATAVLTVAIVFHAMRPGPAGVWCAHSARRPSVSVPKLRSLPAANCRVRMMPIPFQISNQRLRYGAQRASFLNLSTRRIDFLFQFVSMAIMARLLTPADFGVFAMATPFVWIFMTFGDLGLASAVLQQRDLNEGQASAVFRINLVAGIAFGGLFLLSAVAWLVLRRS